MMSGNDGIDKTVRKILDRRKENSFVFIDLDLLYALMLVHPQLVPPHLGIILTSDF